MGGEIEVRCPKCGCLLDGVTLDYDSKWLCSKCASYPTDVLHCERGCKVRAVRLHAGFDIDSKKAQRFLTEGQIYEVESLNIGGWISYITLKEIPDQKFNTVHFIRCE